MKPQPDPHSVVVLVGSCAGVIVLGYRQFSGFLALCLFRRAAASDVDKTVMPFLGRNRTLAEGKIGALNGEAGVQADSWLPDCTLFLWPWQYKGKAAGLFARPARLAWSGEARGGIPLTKGRVLGQRFRSKHVSDARAFLQGRTTGPADHDHTAGKPTG